MVLRRALRPGDESDSHKHLFPGGGRGVSVGEIIFSECKRVNAVRDCVQMSKGKCLLSLLGLALAGNRLWRCRTTPARAASVRCQC